MAKPYWEDKHRTLYNGSCRYMSELSDESVQMCVTSPPYWGLRKYAGEQESIWGGLPECVHSWVDSSLPKSGGVGDYEVGRVGNAAARADCHDRKESNTCSLCGAWRGAYGLEPTPQLYVEHTIEILREIRRVLRKDGVVFWNIDDSYATISGGMNQLAKMGKDTPQYGAVPYSEGYEGVKQQMKQTSGLKHKDLCLIPFRVAIAAQEDGWWVRSVIIWNKPNTMPESVTDRPTGSHEYILMLTKSAKYYWDMEAVREPQQLCSIERMQRNHLTNYDPHYPNQQPQHLHQNEPPLGDDAAEILGGRNIRDVWTFPTQSYPNAHFATYPEKLPELCIKAASKDGDVVLDPFCGSGTTLEVAAKLNRKAIGYEISHEYCDLIIKRNNQSVLLYSQL